MSADAVRRTGIGIEKAGATTKPDEVVEIAASIIYRCDSGAGTKMWWRPNRITPKSKDAES